MTSNKMSNSDTFVPSKQFPPLPPSPPPESENLVSSLTINTSSYSKPTMKSTSRKRNRKLMEEDASLFISHKAWR